MSNNMEDTNGCTEKFAEFCALSTSGELSAEELAMLDEHVADCASCAGLLREYTNLAHVGMAKLAADRAQEIETPFGYNETKAEERFVAALHAVRPHRRVRLHSHAHLPSISARWQAMKRPALLLGAAAVVLVCIGSAFELGRRVTASHPASESTAVVVHTPAPPDGEKTELKAELAAAQSSLKAITTRSAELEKQLTELSDTKSSLVAQIADLTQKDDSDSASLGSVTRQRDGLQQQLNDTASELTRARDDLNRAQQDRQGTLLRVSTLETEVKNLNSDLSASSSSAGNDEQFLAADRDIRELMGARQLYIADVFDVQNSGERSKPFGRVFYTKGKSLIFYAFDLEKQAGYREAKTFQAWGKPDSASGKPISLGIFYVDNEQNRRWVVKSDNSDVLAQINAVFVTVEPHGGSQKPTGKPFLEAYLHSLPPNHP
jgi:anti-sigma-K factor RskA